MEGEIAHALQQICAAEAASEGLAERHAQAVARSSSALAGVESECAAIDASLRALSCDDAMVGVEGARACVQRASELLVRVASEGCGSAVHTPGPSPSHPGGIDVKNLLGDLDRLQALLCAERVRSARLRAEHQAATAPLSSSEGFVSAEGHRSTVEWGTALDARQLLVSSRSSAALLKRWPDLLPRRIDQRQAKLQEHKA
ncbi:hypothetical protein H632_c1398p1, partial [Helicosporidium sp. ATCC 50920]